MTHPNDYIPFIMSRLFAGFFGATPTTIGPRMLNDLFFLHQRGRAFTALHMAFLFGTIAGPTFSGLVSANSFFPVEFWWTVGLLGATAILAFLFLEETGFDRDCLENNPVIPKGYLQNRFATFFFGQRVVQPTTLKETVWPPLPTSCPNLTKPDENRHNPLQNWHLPRNNNNGHLHADKFRLLRRRQCPSPSLGTETPFRTRLRLHPKAKRRLHLLPLDRNHHRTNLQPLHQRPPPAGPCPTLQQGNLETRVPSPRPLDPEPYSQPNRTGNLRRNTTVSSPLYGSRASGVPGNNRLAGFRPCCCELRGRVLHWVSC